MEDGVRVLLKNLWLASRGGVVKGCIFVNKGKIEYVGPEPEPEHELSELQYDFENYAIALHGFSALIDVVEYTVRRLGISDFSVLSRDELKKLTEIGFANAVSNGVTLPIVHTRYTRIVEDVSRELGIPTVLIHEGEASRHSGIYNVVLKDGRLYLDDTPIGMYDEVACNHRKIKSSCRILDLRSTGSSIPPLASLYGEGIDVKAIYRLLTEPYRLLGMGDGSIGAGEVADLQVIDLRDPLKSSIIRGEGDFWGTVSRFVNPDIVFIRGDTYYERGEHLVIPVASATRILEKLSSA